MMYKEEEYVIIENAIEDMKEIAEKERERDGTKFY